MQVTLSKVIIALLKGKKKKNKGQDVNTARIHVERSGPCLFIAWCLAHVTADGFHRTAHTQRLMDRRSKRITPFQSI